MATVFEIVTAMRQAAPPGLGKVSDEAARELRSLTEALMAAGTCAREEYERFLSIGRRRLTADAEHIAGWIEGRTVLVTGGTGCIGSALMAQIAGARPRRLVSMSRGRAAGWPLAPHGEYLQADLRDLGVVRAAFEDIKPDLVFHLGAQRDPGLAEREVHRTVTTNVLGTRNVVAAAERCGVGQVVISSTGKALHPYARGVYCASKRVMEWLAARAAARGDVLCSAARFTHVVDNSIIHERLLAWSRGGVIRLHAPDIAFYAQSALESAQLLLVAGLGAVPGALRVHAIADLGWPVSLLDVAVGVLMRTGATAPIYFSGYDPGYESTAFPGLYDPATAGDLSALVSAFEAPTATAADAAGAQAFTSAWAAGPAEADLLRKLEQVCATTHDPGLVRAALDALSWALCEAAMAAVPCATLAAAARVAAPYRDSLDDGQRRLLAVIEERAGSALA